MNVSEMYIELSKKYDNLLDKYAVLLDNYKTVCRQLYHNNAEIIVDIRNEMRKEYGNNTNDKFKCINYFCPFIRNYCIHFNSDYCINLCNEKRR